MDTSAIFMSDGPAQIKKKINKYAFSGGQDTRELHAELGGNPDVDVAYQYLRFFEEDDAALVKLADEYRKGTLMSGEMKAACIKVLQEFVGGFQKRKAEVTDEELKRYMTPREFSYMKQFPELKQGKKKEKSKSAKKSVKD